MSDYIKEKVEEANKIFGRYFFPEHEDYFIMRMFTDFLTQSLQEMEERRAALRKKIEEKVKQSKKNGWQGLVSGDDILQLIDEDTK